MTSFVLLGPVSVFLASFGVNLMGLAYRSRSFPNLRAAVDRANRRITGRPDWGWLRLWHLMAVLSAFAIGGSLWNLSTLHCSNDAYALLASGQAALHGENPFSVSFCGGSAPEQVPYGLAAVAVNALGAASGSVVGVWVVWELVALAVVPLVWKVGGSDRRYLSVLVTTSILYLPNVTNNIGGLENSIVPISVLLMIAGRELGHGSGRLRSGISAFLSTARFPALFPVLGAAAAGPRRGWPRILLVLVVFLGAGLASYALWGGDAVQVVYLGQFARGSAESLNEFALLVHEGWVHPSLDLVAVQAAGILALLWAVVRRGYSVQASAGILLVGVVLLSQYLNYHFTEWLIPLVLLGTGVNWWLLAVGTVMVADENIAYWYLAVGRGVWWPYEVMGIAVAVLLIVLMVEIARTEEKRRQENPATLSSS